MILSLEQNYEDETRGRVVQTLEREMTDRVSKTRRGMEHEQIIRTKITKAKRERENAERRGSEKDYDRISKTFFFCFLPPFKVSTC